MKRALITLLLFGLLAPAAQADTQYAGSAVYKGRPALPLVNLVRVDDGTVTGRAALVYQCKRTALYNLVIDLRGRADGAAFTVTGRAHFRRGGTMRIRIAGSLDGAGGTAKVRLRFSCLRFTRTMAFRTPSAPSGPPAQPQRKALYLGVTNQTLPVAVRVAGNGRIFASWYASAACSRGQWPVLNATPPTTVRADGTFSRTERYRIRYAGPDEHYRVTFRGRFTSDGAVGTLSARVRYRGRTCRTGTIPWAARP
jgi:hypothetical protein